MGLNNCTEGRCPACGPDPLGGDITNPQSLNRYAYALNNPTTLTDPLGLQPGDFSDPCNDPGYADANAECAGSDSWYGSAQWQWYCLGNPACFAPTTDGGGGGTGGGGSNGGGSNGGGGGETLPPAAGNPNGPGGPLSFPCGQVNGDPLPCSGFPVWPVVLGAGGAFTIYVTSTAQAPQPAQPQPQATVPTKNPCTPLANNLQGTPAAGLDTLFDGFSRLTHPLDVLAVNATMFLAAGGQMVGGVMVAAGGCLEPTPFEPLTCLATASAGVPTIAGGGFLLKEGVSFFENYTLPAIEDWGCHE